MMDKFNRSEVDRPACGEYRRDRMALNELMAIARRYASYRVVDDRPADEILEYDALGLPG